MSGVPSLIPQDFPREVRDRLISEEKKGIAIDLAEFGQQQHAKVGTVYNTTNTGMVVEPLSGEMGFPTGIPSTYQWIRENVNDTEKANSYRDMVGAFFSNLLGTFIYFTILNTSIGLQRQSLTGPPFISTQAYLAIPVALTAWMAYTIVHSMYWVYDADLNPWLSTILLFSPSSWRTRFPNVYRWPQAAATWLAQLVGQFAGTLGATALAWYMENTFTPGILDSSLRAASPLLLNGATPTKAGVILGFAFFVFALTYFSMTLENYRNSSAQTRSLYSGLAMGVAVLISYTQTGAAFSPFQVLSSSIVNARWTGFNSDASLGNCDAAAVLAGAVCDVTVSEYWALAFVPSLIGGIIAYIPVWFFFNRLTSSTPPAPLKTKSKII